MIFGIIYLIIGVIFTYFAAKKEYKKYTPDNFDYDIFTIYVFCVFVFWPIIGMWKLLKKFSEIK